MFRRSFVCLALFLAAPWLAIPFAGKPGAANCVGKSVAALAAALGYSGVQELQDAIKAFCRP
jgi:hypothetical protein